MKFFVTILSSLGLALTAAAQFYGYNESQIVNEGRIATRNPGIEVRVDQNLNGFVPLEAKFSDESGKSVALGDYFKDKPVVLLPIFYKCPGICETELYSMVDSLKGFKKDFAGREYEVIVYSIDPREKPELALAKKDTVISAYMSGSQDKTKRLLAEKGIHLLTGDKATIDLVSNSIGFKFTYDNKGNIVHPACLVVLTPGGKISRYFVATEYPQRILLDSIRDASANLVGIKDERPFYLACIQIDPLTGQKSMNILNTLKTMGVITIFCLLVSILVWNKRHKAFPGGTE